MVGQNELNCITPDPDWNGVRNYFHHHRESLLKYTRHKRKLTNCHQLPTVNKSQLNAAKQQCNLHAKTTAKQQKKIVFNYACI